MFMDSPEDERTKLVSCLGAFRQYWSTLPQVSSSSSAHTVFLNHIPVIE
uniref:Uncharacterized protein n=1 Tax=Cyprinus carpio TaxID=7962 RepID=A0A8C2D4B7_CYPCA